METKNISKILFDEYKKRMWYIANEICDDALDAENAVHDALYYISKNPDCIDKDNLFKSVISETKNATLDVVKKTKNRKVKKLAKENASRVDIETIPEENEIEYEFSRRFMESFETPDKPQKRKRPINKRKLRNFIIAVVIVCIVSFVSVNKYNSYSKKVAYPEYTIFVKLTALIYGDELNKWTDPGKYTLRYLPEGFEKVNYEERRSCRTFRYENKETDQYIEFEQFIKAANFKVSFTVNGSSVVTVGSTIVGYAEEEANNRFTMGWEDEHYIYQVLCSPGIDIDLLLSNVNNLTRVE